MGSSSIKNIRRQFVPHIEKALKSFHEYNIPFAAVAIKIPRHKNNKQIEKLLDENFREKTDVILKGDGIYAIMMWNTTVEAAITASERITDKLYLQIYYWKESSRDQLVDSSLDIMGCEKGSREIQFVHLDLCQRSNYYRRTRNIPLEIGTYIKWSELARRKDLDNIQEVNIRV
jgi:hypothetical protein